MMYGQGQSRIIRLANSRPMQWILTILVLVLAWKVLGMALTYRRLHEVVESKQEEVVSLGEDRNKYRELVQALADPLRASGVVRDAFIYKKPGEHTVIIVDNARSGSSTSQPGSWTSKIKSWFGKR